jgi:diaminohydroxyphosphoribosylaminopyrimidine deaminase/5-amino-6-(5-phosphoribosylamino)uracil reductase
VVLKLAATLDGRTAAPDGSSRWITGEAARADAHRLRAESDAVIVGAGTVRADDPSLTVRDVQGRDPLRVVLGKAPADAKVQPALELTGDPGQVLDDLGRRGVLQALVEGGPTVAGEFHRAGLVDRYVLYLAPALFGGDDGRPLFAGPGAPTIADVWRGRIESVERLGDDLRVECSPA